jgi:hypothetical protein
MQDIITMKLAAIISPEETAQRSAVLNSSLGSWLKSPQRPQALPRM